MAVDSTDFVLQPEQPARRGEGCSSSAPHYGFYTKGEETRQRLLDVASTVFAEKGFAGASTREIAQLASTNIVSIHYYFGSKRNLYREAMESSVQKLTSRFSKACKRAEILLHRPSVSKQQLHEGLLQLLDDTVLIMLGLNNPLAPGNRLCWMHDDDPNGARNRAQEELEAVSQCVCAFLARLTNSAIGSREVKTQSLALMAIITFPWRDQTLLLRSLGWERLDQERIQQIRDALRALLRAIVPSSI